MKSLNNMKFSTPKALHLKIEKLAKHKREEVNYDVRKSEMPANGHGEPLKIDESGAGSRYSSGQCHFEAIKVSLKALRQKRRKQADMAGDKKAQEKADTISFEDVLEEAKLKCTKDKKCKAFFLPDEQSVKQKIDENNGEWGAITKSAVFSLFGGLKKGPKSQDVSGMAQDATDHCRFAEPDGKAGTTKTATKTPRTQKNCPTDKCEWNTKMQVPTCVPQAGETPTGKDLVVKFDNCTGVKHMFDVSDRMKNAVTYLKAASGPLPSADKGLVIKAVNGEVEKFKKAKHVLSTEKSNLEKMIQDFFAKVEEVDNELPDLKPTPIAQKVANLLYDPAEHKYLKVEDMMKEFLNSRGIFGAAGDNAKEKTTINSTPTTQGDKAMELLLGASDPLKFIEGKIESEAIRKRLVKIFKLVRISPRVLRNDIIDDTLYFDEYNGSENNCKLLSLMPKLTRHNKYYELVRIAKMLDDTVFKVIDKKANADAPIKENHELEYRQAKVWTQYPASRPQACQRYMDGSLYVPIPRKKPESEETKNRHKEQDALIEKVEPTIKKDGKVYTQSGALISDETLTDEVGGNKYQYLGPAGGVHDINVDIFGKNRPATSSVARTIYLEGSFDDAFSQDVADFFKEDEDFLRDKKNCRKDEPLSCMGNLWEGVFGEAARNPFKLKEGEEVL